MNKWHKNLTPEKWARYPLKQQMLMIGSELARIAHLKDRPSQDRCFERAFELIDLTKSDPKLDIRIREVEKLEIVLKEQYKGACDIEKIKQYYRYCLAFANCR